MTRTRSLLLLLLGVTFAVYSLGFSGPWLFDDHKSVSANRLLQFDITELDQWRTAASSSRAGVLGRPISMFTFAVNFALAGEVSAFWIKLTNALIHLATGVLIYLLAKQLFARVVAPQRTTQVHWLALLAAAIWLLHPLHVSTVLYAVQRMAQLPALFVCAGLLVYMHYRQRWAERGAAGGEVLAAALWLLLLLLLASYSKENGAVLLPLLLVVEVCFFCGQWNGRKLPALRLAAVALLVAFFALFVCCVFMPPEFLEVRYRRREFTLHERVLTQVRLLWHYLSWLALPNISAMGFQHDDIATSRSLLQPLSTVFALLAWLVTVVSAVVLRQRYPLFLFAVLFYLVAHSVESGVWPLELAYEHRNYLPSVGVCILFAAVLAAPFARGDSGRRAGLLLAGGVPVLLVALLLVRVDTWSDELRLAGVNAGNHPQSSRSNYFYANALLNRYQGAQEAGLTEEASREALVGARYYFEKMYETNPRDVAALVMLHSLDTQYFTAVSERPDWLAKLEQLLQSRRLQASDYNALGALINCVSAGGCDADRSRILALLDGLEARYPRKVEILGWRFTYLLGQEASAQELNAILQRALEIKPGRREFLYRQIQQQARVNDVDGMYESARLWLQHDRQRIFLHALKGLFSTGASDGQGG